jgi:hypothetical protein
MTLLRRRPREVYRVYTEDEYLNGAGLEVGAELEVAAGDGWPAPVGPARKCGGERRLRRAAGVAMLAGAVGTVGGVVVMTGSRAHSGAGRRPGSLVASMRSSRVVRSPAVAGTSAPPWPAVASPGKATHSRVVRAGRRSAVGDTRPRGERHGGSDTRPPGRGRRGNRVGGGSAGAGAKRGGGVAVVVDYVPSSPSVGASATNAAAGGTTATDVSAGTAAPRAGAGKQAEFGFER